MQVFSAPPWCVLDVCVCASVRFAWCVQSSEGESAPYVAGAGAGSGGGAGAAASTGYVALDREHKLFRVGSTVHREEALRSLAVPGGLVPADASERPANDFVSPLLTDMYQVCAWAGQHLCGSR
jgi:hypothetical protein